VRQFALALFLLSIGTTAHAQTYLVVVHGIGGESKFKDRFQTLSASLIDAATNRYKIDRDRITYLAESDTLPGASARSTKANIERVFGELGATVEADARIFVVLIGHGSAVSGSPVFQIPGPDISAQDFAALLVPFATQEIVFVALSSASGGFIPVLSGPRRTIVTATKSDFERNETIFPVHFVAALAGGDADMDQDERLSLLEAFLYARREVERVYQQDNRLQTEHAMLDDNGDGKGTGELSDTTLDGRSARMMFFTDQEAVIAAVDDPDLARLLKQQRALEQELATLRARKNELEPDAYASELESLLLEIARVGRAIREREGTGS
jgi:hypothetical protein